MPTNNGNYTCDECGRSIRGDFVFQDGKRRCPKCAALYFHGALDRMEEENEGKPADESRAATSTAGETSCPICDMSGNVDLYGDGIGVPCPHCGGTGVVKVRR